MKIKQWFSLVWEALALTYLFIFLLSSLHYEIYPLYQSIAQWAVILGAVPYLFTAYHRKLRSDAQPYVGDFAGILLVLIPFLLFLYKLYVESILQIPTLLLFTSIFLFLILHFATPLDPDEQSKRTVQWSAVATGGGALIATLAISSPLQLGQLINTTFWLVTLLGLTGWGVYVFFSDEKSKTQLVITSVAVGMLLMTGYLFAISYLFTSVPFMFVLLLPILLGALGLYKTRKRWTLL